eukprot:scaffold36132_cov48-Phaeocystis_antarctica.AAC.2
MPSAHTSIAGEARSGLPAAVRSTASSCAWSASPSCCEGSPVLPAACAAAATARESVGWSESRASLARLLPQRSGSPGAPLDGPAGSGGPSASSTTAVATPAPTVVSAAAAERPHTSSGRPPVRIVSMAAAASSGEA